jgi:hypothetical protein
MFLCFFENLFSRIRSTRFAVRYERYVHRELERLDMQIFLPPTWTVACTVEYMVCRSVQPCCARHACIVLMTRLACGNNCIISQHMHGAAWLIDHCQPGAGRLFFFFEKLCRPTGRLRGHHFSGQPGKAEAKCLSRTVLSGLVLLRNFGPGQFGPNGWAAHAQICRGYVSSNMEMSSCTSVCARVYVELP